MSIRDLLEQFTIQGAFCIKKWVDKKGTYVVLAEGNDFDCAWYKIKDKILDAKIDYMYCENRILNIEVEI